MRGIFTKLHRHNLSLGYYPGSMGSAIICSSIFAGYSYCTANPSGRTNNDLFWLSRLFPQSFIENSETLHILDHIITGLLVWIILCKLRKWILRNLFLYQGWLYEGKTPSIKTKIFFVVVRILNGWTIPISKMLYGCQGILPSLPVPGLKSSVNKYLASMKQLMDKESYSALQDSAKQFLATAGPKLQLILLLRSLFVQNYITDWWGKYVYLRGRTSLLHSNYFVQYIRDQSVRNNHKTVAEAALFTHFILKYRESIEKNSLQPLLSKGIIPSCSWQFEQMFNTCRIPGEEEDSLEHQPFSDHVVCRHRGRYFKLDVYKPKQRNVLLSPAEFQYQYRRIIADDSEPADGEERLFTLTAWDRKNWAKTRNKYFKNGINKMSLDAIEQSAMTIQLDETFEDGINARSFEAAGLRCCFGPNWFDKSMNFRFCQNEVGTNVEHSWGDGTAAAYLAETGYYNVNNYKKIDEEGYVISNEEISLPNPQRLAWDLPKDCIDAIAEADKAFLSMTADFDLKVIDFTSFGRGSIKQMNTSPDAFVQMALQLAYFRDQGKFGLTYESSMTQLFLKGRTETVRSCSEESCKWVRSMEDGQNREEQNRNFKAACFKHQQSIRQSMTGEGFDRHFLGLFILAKYFKIDTPFLQEALSSPWLLSTSQTPAIMTDRYFIGSPSGGFAPSTAEGYGVSYLFCGEDRLYFQVSSNRSCLKTDSARFASTIQQALLDIQDLLLSIQPLS
ncbi:unnamed protein product [Allacma fusca]|uniref:Choline/carnitine acyltransferase domain-containing protein n=1 Tax=Allacma fusca TaxID=39272 RepID=A0A8J2PEB0_9HEXA|nr:unnamed protein product [Allacma fusca]